MRGCKLEGGDPERCYVGSWEPVVPGSCVKLWQDHYAGKEPGDIIDSKPVLRCPQLWWDKAWDEALEEDDEYSLTLAGAFSFDVGDCIFDELKVEDEEYPTLKWVAVKENSKDADLLYMVPFFESDPYGEITDPDWFYYKEKGMNLPEFNAFAEDPEGQDHCCVFTGNGTWVHREDLIGLSRSHHRDHLVKPACQSLSDLVSGSRRFQPPSQG